LVETAKKFDACRMLIDGPQAWKASNNGYHARVCERRLATPGKTGLPGTCKPGSYVSFIQFSIELFDALALRGWPRLADVTMLTGRDHCAIESFPTAAWKRLGTRPLPGKRKARAADVAQRLKWVCDEFSLVVPDPVSHDELQAMVAGVAGTKLEMEGIRAIELVGEPPITIEGIWREGYIVVPMAKAAADTSKRRAARRSRDLTIRPVFADGSVKVKACPIVGCTKVFHNGRGGWDAHVGSLRIHPRWRPDLMSPNDRKQRFREAFPAFFE
jgi:hypothetical protein